MVNFELEENIHNYLIYLLAAKQEDYEILTKNNKPWLVLLVILVTVIIQGYALSIIIVDTLLKDGIISWPYYFTEYTSY